MKRAIRNIHSDRQTRFCDVVFENGKTYLEKKTDKKQYERILWDDVVYQVEAAKNTNQ